MRLSIYTFVKDGLYLDFHLLEMLNHHLPLADEIIVNEGFSRDGTFEAIRGIDEKIKVVRNRLDQSEPNAWLRKAKDQARRCCTGDWCILLDCDEFIPEWEFARLRRELELARKPIFAAKYKHFYGNYRVVYENPSRPFPPQKKYVIHQNRDDIEIYGDGSDVRIPSLGQDAFEADVTFECHHFGEVRKAARLRQKWRTQAKRDIANTWDWVPKFMFNLFPHNWLDPEIMQWLHVYDGPLIKAVRENSGEFVRDNYITYKALSQSTYAQ